MPFKSQAQRRKFAQLLVEGKISPETYEEWNRETGAKALPERAGRKATGKRRTTAKRKKTTAKRKKSAANRQRTKVKSSRKRKSTNTARRRTRR